MAELPDGIEVETIWVLQADYTPEARERRPFFRPAHLERIGALMDEGVVIEAGGLLDWSGAILLIRAPDEAAVLALAESDIYTREGVWTNFRARQYGRVVRTGRR